MDLRLPEKNTATRNSIEVAIKAFVGFVAGLLAVVWAVPGVSDAVIKYVGDNWMQTALALGVPAVFTGIINLILDIRKKGLRNY